MLDSVVKGTINSSKPYLPQQHAVVVEVVVVVVAGAVLLTRGMVTESEGCSILLTTY